MNRNILFIAFVNIPLIMGEVILEIMNREPGPIFVGIQGDPGHPHLRNGGFALVQGQTEIVKAPNNWSGKIWPRTWCDEITKECKTGDCGSKVECQGEGGKPPMIIVELSLNDWKGLDYYGISLEYGMNLRAIIEPVVEDIQQQTNRTDCKTVQCLMNINSQCWSNISFPYGGQVIGCLSACQAFDTDLFCCRGYHDRPETCKESVHSNLFKEICPDAYSYKFDSKKEVFTCKTKKYRIQFGVNY
ncbi:hypothetical protein ABEB36_013288 [Hypothenemus hampei]|uniref:Uncharacterized protein n=1 Tax=Hypothenemus hampei TaxID=57062 RepID=A0ABD1E7I3_HYPHA